MEKQNLLALLPPLLLQHWQLEIVLCVTPVSVTGQHLLLQKVSRTKTAHCLTVVCVWNFYINLKNHMDNIWKLIT